MLLNAHLALALASAPWLYHLTSQHIVTRRPVLQKVRHHTRVVLCLLVSIRFQVLFHSPPGVLFTVPSRYYTLSVTWSYLALRDGPRLFRPDFSCPDVLWIPPNLWTVSRTGLLPCFVYLSRYVLLPFLILMWSSTPHVLLPVVWALPISLATTFGIVFYFLFLWVMRCFSSPGSLHYAMYLRNDTTTLLVVSSLIRISTALGLFAAPRSFSQLVTSFFGAMYQGILLYALCSLISR